MEDAPHGMEPWSTAAITGEGRGGALSSDLPIEGEGAGDAIR
jgi:hypothetical protein